MAMWKLAREEIEAGGLSDEQVAKIRAFHRKDNFKELCLGMARLFAFLGCFVVFAMVLVFVIAACTHTLESAVAPVFDLLMMSFLLFVLSATFVIVYVQALRAYEPERLKEGVLKALRL